MGTYNIPRNVKGEGRILYVFSIKSMIYSLIGVIVGLPIYLVFSMLNMKLIGIILLAILAGIGFVIATFKIPEIGKLKSTKTVGGEKIDDIIKRAFLFRRKKNKIYMYTNEEEKKNG